MTSLRSSIAWMGFAQASYFVLQFAGSVAIARLLTPFDVGIFAIASAVVGLLAVIQAMGLNNFLIREPSLTPDLIATVYTVNAIVTLLLALLVAGIALAGGVFFADPGVRNVLLVLAVVPIIGQFAFLPNAMLEREGSFKQLALLRTASTMIGLGLTIGLALLHFRYMSFAYSQVGTALVTNIALMIIARRHLSFRFSVSHWPAVARFGFQVFAISGITRIAQRLSDLLLGRLLGLQALGLYSRASNNYNMLWDNIHTVATRVLFVDFSALKRQGLPLRDRYLQVLATITALLWPALGGVGILAGPLVRIIYGERWLGAALPLSLLCVAGILLVSITMTWEVFVVSGEVSRQARFEFIRTIVGIALFTLGCLHSLGAAAAARIGDAVFAQFLYRPHLHRLTGATPPELGRIYLRSGLLAAAAVLPSLLLMVAWRWSTDIPATQVAAAIVLGMICWSVAVALSGHLIGREAMKVLKRFPSLRSAA